MTKLNLAPTTKEALTEKLRHYFQTLGNLNALDVADDDHTKISEDITSAFIETLKPTFDTTPEPTQKPIGYVVVYEDGPYMGQPVYEASGLCNGIFSSVEAAKEQVNKRIKETGTRYFVAPILTTDLTPIN